MIRTVWLTFASLTLIGALTVGKALTTPATPISTGQAIVEVENNLIADTLTKADRLAITYHSSDVAPSAVKPSLVQTATALPSQMNVAAVAETKIVSPDRNDPTAPAKADTNKKATKPVATQSKHLSTNAKISEKKLEPRRTTPKTAAQSAKAAKPAESPRACDPSGPWTELLKSLRLVPACPS
jgi:hypothetical protein